MKKYINPKNYINRGLQCLNKYILDPLECRLAPNVEDKLKHPPIFFLGAPRSGSTLMIQVLTDAFDFGYISNKHCLFFGAPALAEKIFRPLKNKQPSDYTSNHGRTNQPYAPAECGQWWHKFFRKKPAYVPLSDVAEPDMLRFRASIAGLTDAFDRPVLFKNLYASLRIQAIAKYIPEALFIITERNEIENGHSLLETRKNVFGGYDKWWSMEPPDIGFLKTKPVHEQVIDQIRSIHKTIDNDLSKSAVSSERILRISYEDFCFDVHTCLNRFEEFLLSHNVQIHRMEQVPASFSKRSTIHIDPDLYQKVKAYASQT